VVNNPAKSDKIKSMFKRSLEQVLIEDINDFKISIVFGPRQVGKSYLLNLIFNKNLPHKKSHFFDLEQTHDLLEFSGSPAEIQERITKAGKLIFIDEFHYIKNAGKIFKAIYDLAKRFPKKQIKIFASGSSSIEIHKHIKESMAGRVWTYQLMPLTLDEYLSANRADLTIDEYFIYGGLPEVYDYVGSKRELYLNQILETYIQKDIKSMIKEENITAFNKLLFMLAEYQGQVVVRSALANDLRVSSQTVDRYLELLENTFTLYTLSSFSTNISNELKKSKKYYLYDLGVRNALLKNFKPLSARKDLGTIYETYVLHYLMSIKNKANSSLFFWRTAKGLEVDFVYLQNQEITAIEVKHRYDQKVLTPSLEAFLRAYPHTKRVIIVFKESKKFDSYEEFEYRGYKVSLVRVDVLDSVFD